MARLPCETTELEGAERVAADVGDRIGQAERRHAGPVHVDLVDRQRPQRAAEAGQHQVGNHARIEHGEAGEGQRDGRVPETRMRGELADVAEPPDAHPGDGQGKSLGPARPPGGARAHLVFSHMQVDSWTEASLRKVPENASRGVKLSRSALFRQLSA